MSVKKTLVKQKTSRGGVMMRINSIQLNNNYKPISFKSAKGNNTAITIQYPDTTKFQNNPELVVAKHDGFLEKSAKSIFKAVQEAAEAFRLGKGALSPSDYDAMLLYSNPF